MAPSARVLAVVGELARRSSAPRARRPGPRRRGGTTPTRACPRPRTAAAADLVAARADVTRAPRPRPIPTSPRPRPAPSVVLSASDVEMYRRRPLAYRYARVIDRVPTRSSVARAIGVAAHEALEAHYRPGGTGGDGAALVRRFAVAAGQRAGGRYGRGSPGALAGRGVVPRLPRAARPEPRPARRRGARLHAPARSASPARAHRSHGRPSCRAATSSSTTRPGCRRRPGRQGAADRSRAAASTWREPARPGGSRQRGARLDYVLDGDTPAGQPRDATSAPRRSRTLGARADDIARRPVRRPRTSWACRTCDFVRICPAQDR